MHSIAVAAAWKIDEWFSLAFPCMHTKPRNLEFRHGYLGFGLGSMEYQASLSWEKNTAGDWFAGFNLRPDCRS